MDARLPLLAPRRQNKRGKRRARATASQVEVRTWGGGPEGVARVGAREGDRKGSRRSSGRGGCRSEGEGEGHAGRVGGCWGELGSAALLVARAPTAARLAPLSFPAQLFAHLRSLGLEGLLVDGIVWLPVSESTRRLLDELCLGNLDGAGPCVEEVVRELPPDARAHALWARQLEQERRERQQSEKEQGKGEGERKGEEEGKGEGAGGAEGEGDGAKEGEGASAGGASPSPPAPSALVIPGPPPLPWVVRMNADEAFFCAYALGALRLAVPAAGGASPARFVESPNELWTLLTRQRPDFPLLYVAYHHFRARGWIPRTGLQYGADYVIYHAHPGRAHSELVALVALEDESDGAGAAEDGAGAPQAAAEATRSGPTKRSAVEEAPPGGSAERSAAEGAPPGGCGGAPAGPACVPHSASPAASWLPAASARRLAWRDVQVTNRLAAQVSKRLLLATVFLPRGTRGLASPACLESAAVRETLVRRWVPEAHAGV